MKKDEIKQALKCCVSTEYGMCKQCPNYDCVKEDCVDNLKRQALDLITEQEKEIEQLKTNAEILARGVRDFNKENYGLSKKIKKLKAENERFESNMRAVLEIEKKQAKIEALNELRGRADLAGIMVVTVSDIDEMIEELKKMNNEKTR